MKPFIFCLTFLFFSPFLKGQTYYYPDYSRKSLPQIELLKVEINHHYTIVECQHVNPYIYGGWAAIEPFTALIIPEKGVKYKLIKAEGIPVSPKRHYYEKQGESLKFKLYFPSILPQTKHFHLIESSTIKGGFNFFFIQLKPIA